MSILSDRQILQMCRDYQMISPFESSQIRQGGGERLFARGNELFRRTYPVISYGLSSYGYDLRLAPDGFRVFSPIASSEIDPKNFDEKSLIEAPLRTAEDGSKYWLLPPHSYALGATVETFNMPRNVLGICLGKSTFARCGLIVNTTPLESGWKGRLVLELFNATNLPLRVYANEGIAQVTFFESDEDCEVSYADRAGKYQNQAGIVTALA